MLPERHSRKGEAAFKAQVSHRSTREIPFPVERFVCSCAFHPSYRSGDTAPDVHQLHHTIYQQKNFSNVFTGAFSNSSFFTSCVLKEYKYEFCVVLFKSATGRLDAGMRGAVGAFHCASLASCRRLILPEAAPSGELIPATETSKLSAA